MSYQRYQPRRSAGRSKYVWIGAGLLAVVGVAAGIIWTTTGNKGVITPAAAPSKVVHGPAQLDFISPYIYFSYSSTYQAVRQTPAGTSLQMAMLNADTSYQKHLAVSFRLMPEA